MKPVLSSSIKRSIADDPDDVRVKATLGAGPPPARRGNSRGQHKRTVWPVEFWASVDIL